MARLIKLFDEKKLLLTLQADTLLLIRDCQTIGPIKKFIECHDVLRLTWDITERYPREWPEVPECDEAALLHLKKVIQELFVFFGPELPRPGFDLFDGNVKKLLQIFRVPRKGFNDVRTEDGAEIPNETETNMSPLFLLDVPTPRPDPKK